MKRILFIINPISGVGRQRVIEKNAEAILDKSKCSYFFTYTQHKLHAREIAKKEAPHYDIIVAVGGDGTVNEIASAIVGTSCSMAIVPTGSGNGLARCLGIPINIKKAINLIQSGSSQKMDVLSCNNNYFVNVGGIGFDAEVGHQFDVAPRRGMISYIKITLENLLHFKPQQFTIEINGTSTTVEALLVCFANSNQWGNNIKIAPKSSPIDGVIDIVALKKFPFYQALFVGLRLLTGTILKSKYIEYHQAHEVKISNDSIPLKYHLDGEPMISVDKTLHFFVHPQNLSVIVKKKLTVL